MSILSPTPQWRMIPGHIHGLAQPALWGQITVDLRPGAQLAAFEAFMRRVVPGAIASPSVGIDECGVLEHVVFWIGELQRHARIAISMRAFVALATQEPSRALPTFDVALPVASHWAAASALQWVLKAANACLPRHQPPAATLDALAAEAAALLPQLKLGAERGFNTYPLLLAAYRLDVPVRKLSGRIVRLGLGTHARMLESSVSDTTSALGVNLASDKWLTARLLRGVGLPGTVNDVAADAERAVALAATLGYPVVVKPADQDQGRGVSAHLQNAQEVRDAFVIAAKASRRILVEKHVDGFGHRFTVHDGQVLAVLKRIAGGVTGDGQHTVTELLALQLQQPRVQRSVNLGRVSLDAEALALLEGSQRGPHSVVAASEFVLLRRRDNISAGGTNEHLSLDQVHPDNLALAVRAAKALYLDIAGVDILSPDIGRSWREHGAAICEVNARPQFGPGAQGDNYERMLTRLLGASSRIPVHIVLCGNQHAPELLQALQALRRAVGAQAVVLRAGRVGPRASPYRRLARRNACCPRCP